MQLENARLYGDLRDFSAAEKRQAVWRPERLIEQVKNARLYGDLRD